jgi:hypothetical protein
MATASPLLYSRADHAASRTSEEELGERWVVGALVELVHECTVGSEDDAVDLRESG